MQHPHTVSGKTVTIRNASCSDSGVFTQWLKNKHRQEHPTALSSESPSFQPFLLLSKANIDMSEMLRPISPSV